MSDISLLNSPVRVSTPFIKVTLAGYTFGVYQTTDKIIRQGSEMIRSTGIQYPNYIQSLQIAKINGQVNQYTLSMRYAVTDSNDPNFFEKILSKVSKDRKIIFSYGDLSAPTFVYRNEEAIITDVKENFDINGSVIQYEISAVSSSKLGLSSAYSFPGYASAKPSDIIKRLLQNNTKYGLLDIYYGMRGADWNELIASDDIAVHLEAQYNMTVLDYLKYLVNSMKKSNNDTSVYVIKTIDDTSGKYDGPYFRVMNVYSAVDSLDTYEIDIGYPSSNVITSFTIDNNEAFSILYDHSKSVNTNEYVQRVDDNGNVIDIYSPVVSSNNPQGITHSDDETWWRNVTEFPISAQIKLKGVLRPAILMSKVRLKIYFYGHLHSASGLYIINKQVDDISTSGCWTSLNLVRVGGDDSLDY